MREDFYQSQYGNEANKTALALAAAAAAASSSSSSTHKLHDNMNHYGQSHPQQVRRSHHGDQKTIAVDEDDDGLATRTSSAAAFL